MSNYNLQRFINAQDNNNSYARALQEIRRGQKTGYFDDVEFAVYGKNENYECFRDAMN